MAMTITLLLLLLLFQLEKYSASDLYLQSDIEFSDWGKQFQPINSIELLGTLSTSTVLECSRRKHSFLF